MTCTETLCEVENLSPPQCPGTIGESGGDVIGDSDAAHSGPRLDQLELLAQRAAAGGHQQRRDEAGLTESSFYTRGGTNMRVKTGTS